MLGMSDVAVRGDFRSFQRDGGRDEGGLGRALSCLGDLLHGVREQCFKSLFVCRQHACCESSETVRVIGSGSGCARCAQPVRQMGGKRVPHRLWARIQTGLVAVIGTVRHSPATPAAAGGQAKPVVPAKVVRRSGARFFRPDEF